MQHEFAIGDDKYSIDKMGVIHHVNHKPFVYDKNYVQTYDTPDYVMKNEILQALRWGFVVGSFGGTPTTVLDFGYGNGAFLKSLPSQVLAMGYDISGVDIPGIRIVDELVSADVYTFWDALEHVPDLNFVSNLKCKIICISLPWCHFTIGGMQWFSKWKHRKPNEHLHHFDRFSLSNFMSSCGWEEIAYCNIEDRVRVNSHAPHWASNILTMSFRRK
jgi:hypothetical protein